MTDLENARRLLQEGNYTCVVCRGEEICTATARGVRPLYNWLTEGCSFSGFSAADRVVGRATAFLYCLLGVKAVYARVMSKPAAQVLEAHGIAYSADSYPEGIINRQGDGPCPFESAVMEITAPAAALVAIRSKLKAMNLL